MEFLIEGSEEVVTAVSEVFTGVKARGQVFVHTCFFHKVSLTFGTFKLEDFLSYFSGFSSESNFELAKEDVVITGHNFDSIFCFDISGKSINTSIINRNVKNIIFYVVSSLSFI